jgi:hypothetical protein
MYINFCLTEHPPSRKPVPLLHCITKSESQLSYDALFRTLHHLADRLGYPKARISAVGMDHCEALRNAAQATGNVGSEVCVVDCIVHVERNMIRHQSLLVDSGASTVGAEEDESEVEDGLRKKKKVADSKKCFLDAAREDVRLLSGITDRDIFRRGVEVVLADWRYHHQSAFADWFESVYLCDAWDNGAFFAGAGDRPG